MGDFKFEYTFIKQIISKNWILFTCLTLTWETGGCGGAKPHLVRTYIAEHWVPPRLEGKVLATGVPCTANKWTIYKSFVNQYDGPTSTKPK